MRARLILAWSARVRLHRLAVVRMPARCRSRLRRNDPVTKTDLDELERMFAEAGVGSPEEIDRKSIKFVRKAG